MAQGDYLGITVFGWLAICTGLLFLAAQYWLTTQTPWRVGDVAVVVLTACTLVGMACIKARRNVVVRSLVRVAFVWSLASLIAAVYFFIAWLVRPVVSVPAWGVYAAVAVTCTVGYLRARYPVMRHVTVHGAWDTSLTVAHVSDVHIGDVWSAHDLKCIVDSVNQVGPDAVAITGDLLDGMEPVDASVLAPLEQLEAPAYFVSGNHDGYTERAALVEELDALGVTTLEGDVETCEGVCFAGIGYETSTKEERELGEALADEPRPRIVLKHEPAYEPSLFNADVIVSGHVHHGQVWPFGQLARLEFSYLYGLYDVAETFIYVTSGIRTWGPPFRLGTRSELPVLRLVPESDAP